MNSEQLKQIIIETLREQNAFEQLRPVDLVALIVEMMIGIFEKGMNK